MEASSLYIVRRSSFSFKWRGSCLAQREKKRIEEEGRNKKGEGESWEIENLRRVMRTNFTSYSCEMFYLAIFEIVFASYYYFLSCE